MVDLDTCLLRAFVAVAEELNFTRAVERLVLDQQALSALVRQLETRLGPRLFERTTRQAGGAADGGGLGRSVGMPSKSAWAGLGLIWRPTSAHAPREPR